jgi:integrase
MPARPFEAASLYTAQGERKYLNPAERRRFLAAAKRCPRRKLRTLCLTLAYTGCRLSEALALRPHNIDRAGGFLAVRSLKKRKGLTVVREIPVPPDLIRALESNHDLADDACRLWPWCRSQAWRLIKALMLAAGIPHGIHATPKGLRHGFGVHAISSGVPINLVQRWLGHSRMETTAIYLQAIGREERKIAARMWS